MTQSAEVKKTGEELLAELAPKIVTGGGRPSTYKVKPTAEQLAKGKSGDRVPGVTTITKRFQESGGLIRWAFNCGRDGIDMDRARDDAADAGHVAHQWVDDTIHGRPLKEYREFTEEQLAGPRNALAAFVEWREQVELEIVATEVPLISEALRFGGTFDAIFCLKRERVRRLVLGDWKSGNRVYPEHIAQLGGYAILIEENDFLRQFGVEVGGLQGAQLLRFDKEFGSFAHFSWPVAVLELGKTAFRQMRSLYDVCARLGKAAG